MKDEVMKFSDSHEWVNNQDGIASVGITDHAQHELGDIVFIEMPQIGKMVKKGMEVAVLESTKAASDVYSPVSGEIVEVNLALKETPELINEFPESKGWLFKIKLSDESELMALMDARGYKEMLHGRL
jgi:glycine cleavage system H protein